MGEGWSGSLGLADANKQKKRIHLGMQGTQVGSLMGTKILHAIEHVKAHCNTAAGPVPQPENLRAATKDPYDTTKILHATTNT